MFSQHKNRINPQAITDRHKIGMGGFSTVYSGRWNNIQVAVKQSKMIKESDNLIYKNEKHILLTLSMLNPTCTQIVQYLGHTRDDDKTRSLVIEYIPGGDLVSYLEKSKHHPADLHHIMLDAAYGLSHLHANDIIHCDIKPDNIMITADGHGKIVDFGFAIMRQDIKKNQDIRGTPAYIAPELFDSMFTYAPYSEKSDVYSYAMVLFTSYSNRNPYPSSYSVPEISEAACTNKRPAIPTHCPPKIAKLITLGWMHDPDGRPSAKDIAKELENIKKTNQI